MKHKNNGKRYNDDFRKMVVELYKSGQSVKSLSSEYGVSEVQGGSSLGYRTDYF